ncbi:tetratricopeptide repeat protein [Sphingomonas elodea]|uniref:tetratricopeptide repeat protein n=1 Tax=Sphingomonas elodea TaxID=179878 RepID=UPI00026302B5|nr:tetratricopeptide repeat protein [Sphingomonas elodea]
MSIKLVVAALAPTFVLASPAAAQDGSVAAREIMTGAYAKAEHKLLAQMQAGERPEVQLNLAAVYYATGRTEQARALYRDVLAQANVPMNLSTDRTANSHTVAMNGLRYLEKRQQTASR